jgi:hypothetical protein
VDDDLTVDELLHEARRQLRELLLALPLDDRLRGSTEMYLGLLELRLGDTARGERKLRAITE